MERVQFQQEQMLNELKDLVDKHLFTEKETKQIIKKRTEFETALVRRVAKKSDFLRYVSYEMGLEQLRRIRAERIKTGSTMPSISDYALVRRQFHIFERALKKFKADVGLWIQYIQVAQREGARALVGRITARAMQMHPNQPSLYILAASHELSHQSPSAARTLLQRGIRLNEDSIVLWREYAKMELGFIESLRRRWGVLGINRRAGDLVREGGEATSDDHGSGCHIISSLIETAAGQESIAGEEEEEGATPRREIMNGGIVKSVMTSAMKAVPRVEMFEGLKTLLMGYPSPQPLRHTLLEHLYDLLGRVLPDDAGAIRLLASRFIPPDVKGEGIVDGLEQANEEMLARIRGGGGEEMMRSYAAFVEEWCGAPIDDNLKEYLISTLRMLIKQQKHARMSPSLLSAHIKLLTERVMKGDAVSGEVEKVEKLARKYARRVPGLGKEKTMLEWLVHGHAADSRDLGTFRA